MRITRETLLKIAKDTVTQQVRARHDLASVFLIGSLLSDDPLLGGTTDIDLIFIHDRQPEEPREIVRMSPEITLDIAHHSQTDYNQPRHLRLHPWIGPAIRDSHIVFYDTQHWFEFTQASVSSQFYLPENVYGRAQPSAAQARQIWLGLQTNHAEPGLDIFNYLQAVELASNAVSGLTGSPLTERRFLVNFPERARAINQAGLVRSLLDLLGADQADPDHIKAWLPAWQEAYLAIQGQSGCPIRLHSERLLYYEKALETLLSSDMPAAALWPLLYTWADIIHCLPNNPKLLADWQKVCQQLHLDLDHFEEKLSLLDTYLDTVDEILDSWAKSNGIS